MTKDMTAPFTAPGESAKARSAAADSPGAGTPPNPEVAAKPRRRQFTAAYRLRILEEADRCTTSGEIGQLLRREGLYSSHLSNWRKAQREGSLAALAPKKRGARPKARNPLEPKLQQLEAENARLKAELHKAHTILDVQEKVAGLLGFDLESGKNS
jgi:transposase-like protein